jgi:AraC-like DNA-binding protein
MRYQQIPPAPILQRYIRYFWVLENNAPSLAPRYFKIIPDGNPGLIFQDSRAFADSAHQLLPAVFIYGQTTAYTEHISTGKFTTIGVYFYPDALKDMFGIPGIALTDRQVDVALITRGNITAQLMNAGSINQRISILSAFFISLLKKNKRQENGNIQYCLSKIHAAKGQVSLKDFPRELYMSQSSFERSFKQTVGISPKLYTRITRFQASLNQLRSQQYQQLSDIAFDHYYADQSHFIREFKAFTGIRPHYFSRQTNEILANFPELLH